jgi:hypothetical protein
MKSASGVDEPQLAEYPLDYDTITHHSDMDTWDHAGAEDLMQLRRDRDRGVSDRHAQGDAAAAGAAEARVGTTRTGAAALESARTEMTKPATPLPELLQKAPPSQSA